MTNRTSFSTLTLAGLLVTVALPACPSTASLCDNGACEAAGHDDGGPPGTDADANVPVDECLNKPDAPECLSEETALFVSAAGDATAGDGTKANPLKSIGAALERVAEGRKRIYVCEGTYPEAVVLGSKHAGVSLFGGFTCDWQVSEAKPTVGDGPLALKISGATGVAISGLAFVAADATEPGGSSIGAFVANADVTFKGVRLAAGKGKDGSSGTLVPYTYPAADVLKGKNAAGATAGAQTAVTCPGDASTSTVGGAGGASDGDDGKTGTTGPDNAGTLAKCLTGSNGGDGEPGVPAPAAAAGGKRGTLTADGWRPEPGIDGTKGGAGQGGGGGAGRQGGGGGGGAAGGCGGAGGPGGRGGGASIALALLQATVRSEGSSLAASDAGRGGDGSEGQTGQTPGGLRGFANAGSACNGGLGGPGGNGGAGAGGSGGVSIGVLYMGTSPELDAPTTADIVVGTAGVPGTGGKPGAAPAGNDGPAGVAEKIKDASQL